MITDTMIDDKMVTIDFLRLNSVLIKMVRKGQLTNDEREDLLHKSGLIKLEDGRWQEEENAILTLINE